MSPFSCLIIGILRFASPSEITMSSFSLYAGKNFAESIILKLPSEISSSASLLSWTSSIASMDELPYLTPHMA